jgi:2,4-dienoyl-CoA reductase-like NADH-dependent reductase (Old Yellow Enzyme family)
MAEQAGFDAVEVHLGHNYLASSFLSPKLNRRKDEYGGSLDNRARLARDIARAVHAAVGGRLAVIAKLNMEDGARGGFALPESAQVAQWLEQDGTVDALELTAGSSLLNPMYLFRGDAPLRDFAAVMPQPIRLGVHLFGRRILRSYPYEDAYLRDQALQIRAAVRLPLIFLGGVTTRPVVEQAMADGFQFVAMARALLREPDLVRRMQRDAATPSLCTHCNRCMPTNYTGTRCVLIDDRSPRTAEWASGGTVAAGPTSP